MNSEKNDQETIHSLLLDLIGTLSANRLGLTPPSEKGAQELSRIISTRLYYYDNQIKKAAEKAIDPYELDEPMWKYPFVNGSTPGNMEDISNDLDYVRVNGLEKEFVQKLANLVTELYAWSAPPQQEVIDPNDELGRTKQELGLK